ncbi:hypothetical protein ACF0H5_005699 [Mactra antiquata]
MATKPYTKDQQLVTWLIRLGTLITFTLLPTCMYFMPVLGKPLTSAFDRVVFTLRYECFSTLAFFAAIMHVANGRFSSAAIDPMAGSEKLLEFRVRFLQNTFEQFIIGFVGRIILATYLKDAVEKVIPVLVVYFVIARVIFYYGYKRNPLHRAVGMSMTFMSHFAVYFAILVCFVMYGPKYGLE